MMPAVRASASAIAGANGWNVCTMAVPAAVRKVLGGPAPPAPTPVKPDTQPTSVFARPIGLRRNPAAFLLRRIRPAREDPPHQQLRGVTTR